MTNKITSMKFFKSNISNVGNFCVRGDIFQPLISCYALQCYTKSDWQLIYSPIIFRNYIKTGFLCIRNTYIQYMVTICVECASIKTIYFLFEK